MRISDVNVKSYSNTSYHNEELKSLIRYRFNKVKACAKLKQSISRLVTILFPELENLVPTLHMASVYALLLEFPSAADVASAHLTKLIHLLEKTSKGRYGKDTAILFREAARISIESHMPAKSLELKHTIKLIQELTTEIDEIKVEIKQIVDKGIHSPILTIPGISYRIGTMIIAEIGDFSRFDSPYKILPMWNCPLPHTNPDSLTSLIHTWKNEVPDISATLYSIPLILFATGILFSMLIFPKSTLKANITTLPYPYCKESCKSDLSV